MCGQGASRQVSQGMNENSPLQVQGWWHRRQGEVLGTRSIGDPKALAAKGEAARRLHRGTMEIWRTLRDRRLKGSSLSLETSGYAGSTGNILGKGAQTVQWIKAFKGAGLLILRTAPEQP